MKNAGSLLLVSVFAFTSVFAQYDDDVYYSPKKDKKVVVKQAPAELPAPQPQQSTPAQTAPQNGDYYDPANNSNTQSTPSDNSTASRRGTEYDQDDYYDYAYASRIRRFHQPACYGGYYSNYYTDTYWYDPRPFNWGLSIYMGYNFWGPSYYTYSYNPYMAWSMNFGYYDPYFDPYWSRPYGYGWGGGYGGYYGYNNWGYGGYAHGYNNGYNQGYWNGYNDATYYNNNNYYNSYDNNSHYYGPRNSAPTNGVRPGLTASSGHLGVKYENAVASGAVTAPHKVDAQSIPVINTGGPNSTRPNVNSSKPVNGGVNTDVPARSAPNATDTYSKPGNTNTVPTRNEDVYYEPRPNRNAAPQQPVQTQPVQPQTPVYNNDVPQGRPNRNAVPQQPVQAQPAQPQAPVRVEPPAQGRPNRSTYDQQPPVQSQPAQPMPQQNTQPRVITPVPQQSMPTPEINRGGRNIQNTTPTAPRSGNSGGGTVKPRKR